MKALRWQPYKLPHYRATYVCSSRFSRVTDAIERFGNLTMESLRVNLSDGGYVTADVRNCVAALNWFELADSAAVSQVARLRITTSDAAGRGRTVLDFMDRLDAINTGPFHFLSAVADAGAVECTVELPEWSAPAIAIATNYSLASWPGPPQISSVLVLR